MVFKSIQTKEGPHMCSSIKFSIGIPNNGNIFEFLSILFLELSIPTFFHIPSSRDLPANPDRSQWELDQSNKIDAKAL